MIQDAEMSPCGTYRYTLTRLWNESPPLTFVMLNPSTADANDDDPTIRRCIGFARREGWGGIVVLNLFAYRTPSPQRLVEATHSGIDITGPDNRHWARTHLGNAVRFETPVVSAWGAHGIASSAASAMWHAFPSVRWMCLGRTKSGAPRHPLYVGGDQPLGVWKP